MSADGYDGIVLLGAEGSGKSFLGNALRERGVASYRELEPILREKFGTGEAFRERLREVGEYVRASYFEQLRKSALPVAIESAGALDRPLLEALQRDYRMALVHVRTDRALCIERMASRPPGGNIGYTTDRAILSRIHDRWQRTVFPSYRFNLTVPGDDTEAAVSAIAAFLGEK